MIIACPACATRYVVPDSAIGVDGRTVRCAKCRHSWFQDGPVLDLARPVESAVEAPVAAPPAAAPPPPPPPEPVAKAEPEQPLAAESSAPEPPIAQPEPQPPAPEPPLPEPPIAEPPVSAPPSYADPGPDAWYDDEQSRFAHEPPFRPRRNPARLWTIAAVLFAAVTLGGIGATMLYGAPSWLPFARPTFAESQPGLVLEFPPNRQDRRTLPNGTEFFGASGTITNVGSTRRSVPSILIVLRDAGERIVYRWEVIPPKRQLAPGEVVTINEAVTDVPKSAKFAEIGWKPG